jgi:hypothetical protein
MSRTLIRRRPSGIRRARRSVVMVFACRFNIPAADANRGDPRGWQALVDRPASSGIDRRLTGWRLDEPRMRGAR